LVVDEALFVPALPSLDGAAASQKVNHQHYECNYEQQVNQIAADAANRAD
jgi:hypothetical protein